MNRKNKNIASYVEYSVQLHSCVHKDAVHSLKDEIKQFVKDKIGETDFIDDIEVFLDTHSPISGTSIVKDK